MKTSNPGGRPWLKILGIFIIIVVILYFFDIRLIIRQISNANFAYLGAALSVLVLSYLVMAIRLRHMLGNQPKISYTFNATNVANMMNLVTFIPVTWIKIYLMGQDQKVGLPKATSSITVGIAIDWVIKIISLLGVILLMSNTTSVGEFLFVAGILILVILGLLLLFEAKSESIVTKITPLLARLPIINEDQARSLAANFMDGLEFVGSPLQIIITLLWTLLAWVGGYTFYYLGMMAMGVRLPSDVMLAAILFASVVVNPFSPYLPGLYYSLLVAALYIVTQANPESLIALAIVLHTSLFVLWFVLGAIGLRALDLKFSELRKQIGDGIQQMRDAASEKDTQKETELT
jgi:uncharacterized membrane protein YbhN (UPF0104 family)